MERLYVSVSTDVKLGHCQPWSRQPTQATHRKHTDQISVTGCVCSQHFICEQEVFLVIECFCSLGGLGGLGVPHELLLHVGLSGTVCHHHTEVVFSHVRLFVGLFVNRITQKLPHRFRLNLLEEWYVGLKRKDSILGRSRNLFSLSLSLWDRVFV